MYIPEQKNKSIFKTYLIYFICMALFCCVRILSARGWLLDMKYWQADIIATLIIQVLLMFALPFTLYCLFIKVKPKSVFKTCNYNKINYQTVLISIALGILLFFINIIVSSLFNGIISFTGYQTPIFLGSGQEVSYDIVYFLLDVLLVAVLPALCEEFLHRGLLLQGTKHSGFYRAIIISSVMFGLIHFDISKVFYATVLGLILGFVSVVAKNIWVPTIMHFVNNFIAVYLDYAQENKWFGSSFYEAVGEFAKSNRIVVFVTIFILLCVIVVILIYLIGLLFKQTILKRVNKAIKKVYEGENKSLRDEPIVVEKNKMIQTILENNTMLNLNYEEMKSPIEAVMPKQKDVYKTTFKDNIFLISSIVLSGLVTFFTFVWGFF